MENTNKSTPGSSAGSPNSPEPEVLKPRVDDSTSAEDSRTAEPVIAHETGSKPHHRTYRPSHRATFIGLAAVVLILAVNAIILAFVLESRTKGNNLAAGQVSISASALNKIGVNSSTIGNSGIVLTVNPNAQFNGTLTVAGNVTIAGQLKLNSPLIASSANLTQLQAGNTTLSQLDVNGNSTLSSLNLRNNLIVTGTTQLQGAVNIDQLLTINNSLTVTGNVSVGGVFSAGTFSARSLTSTSTLTIGGHVITNGSSPSVTAGSALGSNGTVSINGNDASGIIAVNFGVGPSNGKLVSLTFNAEYSGTPHIAISPVGFGCSIFIESPSISGFSIYDSCSSLPSPGGYDIDYIVEQ